MELPVFDNPAFQFLADVKKAPWMPIVREILGKDVALIHKGMFMSLPGADPQEYHQDGPHLSTQYQKPCHAVNVFVPLVDLCMQNGPTEFCLGSHILGQDEYNMDFVETPRVAAGTPIIFDYRLGHRGLGNSSEACRPILYCTYAAAADGKEFRDSVNFSRKRYHRIGDLVSKAPSRDERKRQRELMVEEQQVELAIAES
jgi:ectoine hydroxylase-related dioxygenase (phytanoyl-CoA dioxygenase family)